MDQQGSWTSTGEVSLLARGQRLGVKGALHSANVRAMEELGRASEPSQDVRGQHLRLLRLQQGQDPVALATESCISLRQLFQLESGESSLFYNERLRNQAGRRVAALLGSQWETLGTPPAPPAVQDAPLQLVAPPAPMALPVPTASAPATAAEPAGGGVAMGLARPAVSTLVRPVSEMARIAPQASPPTPSSEPAVGQGQWRKTLALWLCSVATGAGTGWVLVVHGGVQWRAIEQFASEALRWVV